MRKILLASLTGSMLLGGAMSAHALTASSTFTVSATVAKNCLVAAGTLDFGTYNQGSGTDATGSGTISIRCTKNAAFTVALDKGTTAGGTISQRLLADGSGNTLQYNLYTNVGMTTLFGDGTTGSTVPGTGNGMSAGSAVSVTVYGKLPDSGTNPDKPAGTYSDVVNVTVTY
jgi:spore coat protein U-like protein